MPVLQLEYITWEGTPRTFVLEEGVTRIGRTPDNDLQIDDLALSAQHCQIEVKGESAIVRDVESSSGTFLDGELIEKAPLEAGQLLNLGTFTLNVCASKDASDKRTSAAEKKLNPPKQLSDGTYSCQTHREKRAEFECGTCFSLFCSECLDQIVQNQNAALLCPRCGRAATSLDWSGLERTKEDVVKGLLPEGVQKAIKYWEKYQDWDNDRKGGKNEPRS